MRERRARPIRTEMMSPTGSGALIAPAGSVLLRHVVSRTALGREPRARAALEPISPQIGRAITRVHIGLPSLPITSNVSRIVSAAGVLTFDRADDYVIDLSLDDAPTGHLRDLRPRLPLRLRW